MTLTKEVITDLIIEAIAKNPILGIGIAGDRVLLEGIYSHNIVLEWNYDQIRFCLLSFFC